MRSLHKNLVLTVLLGLFTSSAKAQGGLNAIGLGLVFRPLLFGLLLFSLCMPLLRLIDRRGNSTRSFLFRFIRAFLILIICVILGAVISEFVFPEPTSY